MYLELLHKNVCMFFYCVCVCFFFGLARSFLFFKMKTPQRWRTSRDVCLIVLSPDWHLLVTSCYIMTLHHRPRFDMTSHAVMLWRHTRHQLIFSSHCVFATWTENILIYSHSFKQWQHVAMLCESQWFVLIFHFPIQVYSLCTLCIHYHLLSHA